MRRSMKYLAVLLAGAMALQGTSVLTVADEILETDLVMEEEYIQEEVSPEEAPLSAELSEIDVDGLFGEDDVQDELTVSVPDDVQDELTISVPEDEQDELAVSAPEDVQEEILELESLEEEEQTEPAEAEIEDPSEGFFEETLEEDLPELEDGFAVVEELRAAPVRTGVATRIFSVLVSFFWIDRDPVNAAMALGANIIAAKKHKNTFLIYGYIIPHFECRKKSKKTPGDCRVF